MRLTKSVLLILSACSANAPSSIQPGSDAATPPKAPTEAGATDASATETGAASPCSAPIPSDAIVLQAGASIQDAIDGAPNGATVVLHGGTYEGNVKVGKTIVLRNYPNESPVIHGTDGSTAAVWFYWQVAGSRMCGVEVTGGYYAIKIEGQSDGSADGILIENCKVHDSGYDGIKVTPYAKNTVIRENEVYATGASKPSDCNAQGIDTVHTDNILIEHNYVHDTYSDGIFSKGGSVGATIERNHVVDVGRCGTGNGIDVGMAATDADVFDTTTNPGMKECIDCVVRNNVIAGAPNSGIAVYGAEGAKLIGNTISGFGTAGIRVAAVENWPTSGTYAGQHLLIPSSDLTASGNQIESAGGPIWLLINTSLGVALTGSLNTSNNQYYDTAGAATFRDDTHGFSGTFSGWKAIWTDSGSVEGSFTPITNP